jgi:hypothetical protein
LDDISYARFRSGISGDRHSERSEESLYFARSTVDTTGKIQGSIRFAQDDGHFNDYTFAGNALELNGRVEDSPHFCGEQPGCSCEEIIPAGIPECGGLSAPQDENTVLLRSK